MALTINGVAHGDGEPLTVQGVQAGAVTVQIGAGTPVEAWRNITDAGGNGGAAILGSSLLDGDSITGNVSGAIG